MAKRKVPGLGKSKGMQTDFPTFPAGNYTMLIEEYSEKESSKGTSTIHTFRMRCIDVLDDKPENKEMIDKIYFHRMIEMHDDHPSYAQYSYIFVDELKSLVDAAGVEIKADALDFESFVDCEVVATLKLRDGKDEEGNPKPENVVRKWKAVE